jgi:hypothetical protein
VRPVGISPRWNHSHAHTCQLKCISLTGLTQRASHSFIAKLINWASTKAKEVILFPRQGATILPCQLSLFGFTMSLPSRESSPAADDKQMFEVDARPHSPHVEGTDVKPKSPEDRQAALQAARKIDPGVNPWSVRAMHFYLIVLCVFCCSGDNGFDGTVMSGINAMSQYQ